MTRCAELHEVVHALPRYRYPFEAALLPQNGIYVVFEEGEYGHQLDRVVRVGSHTGGDQLRARLAQHFVLEKKDRSIFRKNIGRAILNQRRDPYLAVWDRDLTSKKNRENSHGVDWRYQHAVEEEVSSYLRAHVSFVAIPIAETSARLRLETRLIATVNSCPDCTPSTGWLGLASPIKKIASSGLWQTQGLKATCCDEADVRWLHHAVGTTK